MAPHCFFLFLQSWPFGNVMCHAVTFSHVAPVYVSTLTLTAIAIGEMKVISIFYEHFSIN